MMMERGISNVYLHNQFVPKKTWDFLGKGFAQFSYRKDFGFIVLKTYYKLCLIVQTLRYMELERQKRQKHGKRHKLG